MYSHLSASVRMFFYDEDDKVKYVFDFKKGELHIQWELKQQRRIWHHCSEYDVQTTYLNMMRAYQINKNYIDLAEAEQDDIYTGDDFLKQQCLLSYKNKKYEQAFNDCEFSWRANKNGMAAFYLGQMYQWGSLGEKDYYKMYQWYKRSAEAGYPDSYEWLGWAHRFGKGTDVDLELAKKYSRMKQ
jgi:TPR repeat protein